jgi:hypothetical protein
MLETPSCSDGMRVIADTLGVAYPRGGLGSAGIWRLRFGCQVGLANCPCCARSAENSLADLYDYALCVWRPGSPLVAI